MRGQGRAGGGNAGGGRACLGLDPHGRLGVPAREAASTDESKEGLVIIHKIEGHHLIEEGLSGSKPGSMIRLVVQDLLDGCGGFGHTRPLSERRDSSGWFVRSAHLRWTQKRSASTATAALREWADIPFAGKRRHPLSIP